jgi:hypothetical protein
VQVDQRHVYYMDGTPFPVRNLLDFSSQPGSATVDAAHCASQVKELRALNAHLQEQNAALKGQTADQNELIESKR